MPSLVKTDEWVISLLASVLVFEHLLYALNVRAAQVYVFVELNR